MTGRQRRRILWVVPTSVAWLVLGTVPADAHTHPTPIEKSAPGVVYVEARAKVDVALVEHLQSDPGGIHIAIIQSSSEPVVEKASGFVVDPTGTIVTSGLITATQTDLDRASVYAVNEAFRNRYGDQAPMSGDLYSEQRIGDDANRLQQRLEACYPPYRTNDAGGCVVRVEPSYVVYPDVSSQEQYGKLAAERLPSSTPEVALLRVRGASGMPTVALGDSREGAEALSALGFTDVPGGPDTLQAVNTHLAEVGGSTLKPVDPNDAAAADDATRLADGLRNGMHGGPVVAEAGQVIGFLEPQADSGPPPASSGALIDVGAIRAVLSAEKVTPRRGPVDTSFEAAMHAYKNGGYAASIPNLQKTLELYPGHAIAKADLDVAQQNVAAGTPGRAPPAAGATAATADTGSTGGFPWAVVLAVVAAVLLIAAVVSVLLLRRRRDSAAGGATPSPGPARHKEGQPAAPSRPASGHREGRRPAPSPGDTGHREGQAAPNAAPGSGRGAVSVIERGAAGPGGAASRNRGEPAGPGSTPSRSASRQGAVAAAGNGSPPASRAAPAASPAPSSGRAPMEPGAEDRPTFCTTCGARLGPHHRYCGRCGTATG